MWRREGVGPDLDGRSTAKPLQSQITKPSEGQRMVNESDWVGLLTNRTSPVAGLTVTGCLAPGKPTASSPFLAECSDGDTWWVKAPQPNLAKALVTEVVTGLCGRLIGAPVCDVTVVEIPKMLLPWEFKPGVQLPTGRGSATRNLPPVVLEERGNLGHRTQDDNSSRHVGVYAITDWTFGSDFQWLYQTNDDWRIYSHDHGWYLPPSGPDWSQDQLRATVDQPHVLPDNPSGLDPHQIDSVARHLESVTRDALLGVLRQVPASWGATEAELETLGWYLERRAPAVASRIRSLIGVI